MAEIRKFKIEDATICSKNFAGNVSMYNPAGTRKFTVILDEDTAIELMDDGWPVKRRDGREEGDPPRYYLDVGVKFDKYPPVVKLVAGNRITTLDEDTVKTLDGATVVSSDLIITPYNWEFGDKRGVKAYLKTGYFKIEEDEFASKYEDYGDDSNDIFVEE